MGTIQVGHMEHSTDTFFDWWLCLEGAPGLKYAVGQIEEAETGTFHIQVYTEWAQSVRRSEVIRRAGKGHWEPRHSTRKACRDYCTKTDSRIETLGEIGTWRPDVRKNSKESPKRIAIQMLMDGKTPVEICAEAPDVFFTHHRSILETWKMLQQCKLMSHDEEE